MTPTFLVADVALVCELLFIMAVIFPAALANRAVRFLAQGFVLGLATVRVQAVYLTVSDPTHHQVVLFTTVTFVATAVFGALFCIAAVRQLLRHSRSGREL